MPGAVAPARLVCSKLRKNAHEQTTGTTEHPGIPCAMVYGLYVISLVYRAC